MPNWNAAYPVSSKLFLKNIEYDIMPFKTLKKSFKK